MTANATGELSSPTCVPGPAVYAASWGRSAPVSTGASHANRPLSVLTATTVPVELSAAADTGCKNMPWDVLVSQSIAPVRGSSETLRT
ncbi:MAG TPA: hypothetical protein VME22_23740 [Solirubrobacteraceae bacterium]|nr:hypothetical protein [Solirubrobacteraceae bacterium]